MAEQIGEKIQWLNGNSKKENIVEKICPKRHIRQDQWQSEWNEDYLSDCHYDFISDYECIFNHPVLIVPDKSLYGELWNYLQAAKKEGTLISIVNIAHFTTLQIAGEIVDSRGFKGRKKKINEDAEGHDVKAKFSWWSPIFFEGDIKLVRDTLGAAIQPFLAKFHGDGSAQDDEIDGGQDTEIGGDQENEEGSDQNHEINQLSFEQNDKKDDDDDDDDDDQVSDQDGLTQLLKQFASSHPFNPAAALYGKFYFQYGINELCDHYRNSFDGDQELQFKILGTFSYKKEVMHAVLICSQEYGKGFFKKYPPVLTPEGVINNEAVVTRDNDGNWVWKPQATGTDDIKRLPGKKIFPKYRRWEHVAFAFHIPKKWGNEGLMSVPDLRRNLHYLLS